MGATLAHWKLCHDSV